MTTKLSNTRGWDLDRAMRNLRVSREKFPRDMHGENAGYSYTNPRTRRSYLAIDSDALVQGKHGGKIPVAREMVAFHELGHIVLGHTHETADRLSQQVPVETIRDWKVAATPQYEVEAMMVGVECARRLGIPDEEANYSNLEYYIAYFKKEFLFHFGHRLSVDRVKINDAVEKILAAGLN